MTYIKSPKIANKYVLTFLVWNNLLALLIVLAVPTQPTISFIANFACVLVVSHVTALLCLLAIDLFMYMQRRLGLKKQTLSLLSLFPMSVVLVPALIVGAYASIIFARAFSIDWHPEINEIVKPGILFSLITFMLNMLYYNYIYSVRAFYQKELELKAAHTHVLESKLHMLLSELNPHVLFNALNSVIEVMHHDSNRAESMLLGLCDYYQSILVAFEKKSISLMDELELSKKFIAMHTHEGVHIQLNISLESKDLEHIKLPPLILQPLLENVLKHGFRYIPHEQEKIITITVLKKAQRVHLYIVDNGEGLSSTPLIRSVGLRNCEERLQLLLGPSCRLDISGDSQGTQVLLDIPYDTY